MSSLLDLAIKTIENLVDQQAMPDDHYLPALERLRAAAEHHFNGYVLIVSDEPIPGIPSYRLYGPYETRDHAYNDGQLLKARGLPLKTGVLPLRRPDQLKEER